MNIEQFRDITPDGRRMEYVKSPEGQAWLKTLDTIELDEVGRQLCHESEKGIRTEYPIIGDITPSKAKQLQEQFENGIFGVPLGDGVDPNVKADLRGELPSE